MFISNGFVLKFFIRAVTLKHNAVTFYHSF